MSRPFIHPLFSCAKSYARVRLWSVLVLQAVPPQAERSPAPGREDVDLASTYSALKKLYSENIKPLEVTMERERHALQ